MSDCTSRSQRWSELEKRGSSALSAYRGWFCTPGPAVSDIIGKFQGLTPLPRFLATRQYQAPESSISSASQYLILKSSNSSKLAFKFLAARFYMLLNIPAIFPTVRLKRSLYQIDNPTNPSLKEINPHKKV